MHRRDFARSLAGALALGRAAAQAPSGPAALGSRRELLIDRYLVDRLSGGARLRLHHPERREIALVHDAPWEGSGSGYHTVFRDGGLYRMYYKAWAHTYDAKTAHPLVIAYAESRDGIVWQKPELGLVAFAGSRRNNIILEDIHGGMAHDFSPFRDTNPDCKPEARYKAVGLGKPKGLYAYQSADAIHWKPMREEPVITQGMFDTQNIVFWDARIGRYRAYIRDFVKERRDILTCTSQDFLHWTEPEWLQYPGSPDEQLYTNQVAPYYRAPHLYIGFPARYVDRGWTESTRRLPEPEERAARAKSSTRYGTAVTDTLLMTSRDGHVFHRWEEAFLRPGLRTRYNWSYGDNYLAWQVVETQSRADDEGPELSLYATESYFTGQDARLRRLALRIDGFASLYAPLSGGELVSKPFTYAGRRLLVNFATSAGGDLRFELQEASGAPLPGCSLADCEAMFGDSLEQQAPWKGNPDLSRWTGRPVRLRAVVRDADLYSFRFAPA